MEHDSIIDTSFLIYKLVQKFCPNNLNALHLAIDLLKSLNFQQCNYNTSIFQRKWSNYLMSQGKNLEIQNMNKCMIKIVKSINSPNSLFLLIDQIRNHPEEQGTQVASTDNELYPQSSKIPLDFLFVLQGIEGTNFKWNNSQQRFVISSKISPHFYSLAKKVSDIGCMVRIIQKFLSVHNSLLYQYASIVVQEIYVKHLNFISSIESIFDHLTAPQLITMLSGKPIDDLRSTSIICSTLFEKNASSIFNVLYIISSHGDPSIRSISMRMCEKCFEFITKMIKSWVTKGYVNDPYSEFFVRTKTDVQIYSNWWHDRYFIAKEIVPLTLTEETLQTIFSSGKCLNYLRNFDEPIELEINETLPFEEYIKVSSIQSNKLMLNLIMKDNLLIDSLTYIHDFILLGRGDFIDEILSKDLLNLSNNLSIIIQQFSMKNLLKISINQTDKGVGFSFEVVPPLSAIIGPYELQAYKQTSVILFKIKKCQYDLLNVERSTKLLRILFFEMLNFLNLVYDFLQLQIISKSFSKLLEIIKKENQTFDILLSEHTKHTSNVARGCWVSSSGHQVYDELCVILEVIDSLSDHTIELSEIHEKFHQEILKFKIVLLKHQTSGRELVGPLMRTFKNIFK